MKLNWGVGISIFYGLFVVLMLIFLVWTLGLNRDLVNEDYYEEDKKVQSRIESVVRTNNLGNSFAVKQLNDNLIIDFPNLSKFGKSKANLNLFRPDDKKLDLLESFTFANDTSIIISTQGLKQGLWRIKLDWSAGDSTYYYEDKLMVN